MTDVIESSGNIFADLAVDQPAEALAKARLAFMIATIIKGRHLTQKDAAALLGTDQAKVSALVNGRLHGFSLERLLFFLTALDRDVEIRVKKKPRTRGAARVEVKAA